ncbi:MAG: flagellar hook-length control protein FliK [Candidatus Omnitrophota bacterium]|jgi:hypothetical protein|nr:MAG: flagellar hook-length control protein FliK [Candidatus Omnitrophota bacterium]
MVDPITIQQAQVLSQLATSTGLRTLLQSGEMRGTVLSMQAGGKAVMSFAGRTFPLDVQGQNLQQGQQVLARLVGDQLLLELLPPRGENAGESGSTVSRPLANILANLGVSGANAEVIAQALLQSGIPLDRTVLKDLANVLPDIQPYQLAALSFLLSRGLPISQSLLFWAAHLLTPKPKLAESTNKFLDSIKKFEEDLDEEEPVISEESRRRLKQHRETLEERVPRFQSHSQAANEDELEEMEGFLHSLLASPEAIIQNQLAFGKGSLGEELVRLLALLMDLQIQLAASRHGETLSALIAQAMTLHESLAQQAFQNLQSQDPHSAPVFFVEVPIRDDGKMKNLELRYKPKDKEKKSGTLDLRLDFSQLGPMKISFHWNHPSLSISIVVSQKSVGDFLCGMVDNLKEALTKMGFHVEAISVNVGDVPQTLRPLPETEPRRGISGLDIRV